MSSFENSENLEARQCVFINRDSFQLYYLLVPIFKPRMTDIEIMPWIRCIVCQRECRMTSGCLDNKRAHILIWSGAHHRVFVCLYAHVCVCIHVHVHVSVCVCISGGNLLKK